MSEHPYQNEHIGRACGPCLDFRLNWSMSAGELAAWKSAVALLNKIAAEHFISDRSAEAHELRRIAKSFEKEQVAELSKRLDKFIKGDASL